MRLEKLILRNFLTYDHLEHEFEKKPLLVQGLNLTDDKQKTNGTGKSGMQTGIEFCITASNSRDVRDSELVTYGHKEAHAELFASCDIRKQTLHIAWTIKVKGSNKLELKKQVYGSDEWVDVNFSNILDGKKFILNWFSISKEDLFNYFIINKTRFKSFFKSSNREKVDLINRFSDASIIEGLENIDIDDLQEQFDGIGIKIHSTEGKIELLDSQIENEGSRDYEKELEEEEGDLLDAIEEVDEKIENAKKKIKSIVDSNKFIKDQEIEGLKQDIITAEADKADIEAEIIEASKNIAEADNKLKEAQKLVDAFVSTDWNEERKDYEADITSGQDDVDGLDEILETREEQLEQIKKLVNSIEVELSGTIACPKCLHEFVLGGDIDELKEKKASAEILKTKFLEAKSQIKEQIDALKQGIKNLEADVSKINQKEKEENDEKNILVVALNHASRAATKASNKHKELLQEVKDVDVDIVEYNNSITACENKIKNKKQEIVNWEEKITNYRQEAKNYETQIENLKPGNSEETIKSLESDKGGLEASLAILKAESQELGDSIYEMNQWINNFKQFRMYLANQSLEVIEFHCNRYLKDMGSDMRVKMEGFKTLADGRIKEEITAKIIRDQERTFASFSGGEQGRLLFASILANRHMINETHPYGGLDFLSIDEVFEGVDSVGLKHLVESAKTLNIPVMIITHVTDEEASGDRLLIVKENGISKIKEE